MLIILNGNAFDRDDYAIHHMTNGLDELRFEFSAEDGIYKQLQEEKTKILETTEKQTYVVRKINAVNSTVIVTCQLDLPDWRKNLLLDTANLASPGFSHRLNETYMLSRIMQAPGLSGWSMISTVSSHIIRSMEMEGPTPLEAALQLQKTFGSALRFNTQMKRVTILNPAEAPISNSYAIESVNLRRRPDYKGRSNDLYTRLYPVGKDGIGIASVNSGVPYLDNTSYTGSGVVICALWKDARYTDAASLKRDAQARLEAAAKPVRSWKLDVIDLNRIDAAKWPDLGLSIWTRILLQDTAKNVSEYVQVVSDVVYPYYPEKNQITVSTNSESLQDAVMRTSQALNDANSELWAQINARS